MDQVRKTMMQHEALFKEQVQALHRLYNIQKAAMQETRRRNYPQAQVETFEAAVYIAGRAHKQDALGLSLSPFCTLKEIDGSGSLWMMAWG
ncbi:hypothetical protein NC651_017300 [Populus alba x Populus x berolinensis]|nr:hypothetical protein NC651_017300 [Populus alba x Populus x berolinensis]